MAAPGSLTAGPWPTTSTEGPSARSARADATERSLDEYERLLGGSGFALEQAIALPSSFSILDFRPQ
jgi:hypothetical protein